MLHVSGFGGGGPKSDQSRVWHAGRRHERICSCDRAARRTSDAATVHVGRWGGGDGRHLRRDDGALPSRCPSRHRSAGRRQSDRAAGPPDRVVHAGLRPTRERFPAGWATSSPPARPATPTRRRTGSGWPCRAPRTTWPPGSTAPSIDPTWRRIRTTSTRCRRKERGEEIDAWWPAGSVSAPWTRPCRFSTRAEVAAAPIYDAQQLMEDEHLRSRGTFVPFDDPDLGPMTVQAPVAVMNETPGHIAHLGRIWAQTATPSLGTPHIDPERLAALRAAGVIIDAPGGSSAQRTASPTIRAGDAGQ